MKQIIVRLFNGLGNQLFQYAAGRSLAKTQGASLRLVYHDEQRPVVASPCAPRPLLLQNFAVPEPIEPMNSFDRLMLSAKHGLRIPGRIARAAMGIQVLRQNPEDIPLVCEFEIDPNARTIYQFGWWQDYSLVRGLEGELRRHLVLRSPLQARSLEFAERIHAARRPVSIHFRHGDYMTTFGPDGLLPLAYYERAIDHMLDQYGDTTFFVFSDDIAFARQWARGNSRMIVVDCNDAARAHEAMWLMSLCRHHIIANSTFSWWGAWLNSSPDKQVIAPDSWLGFDTATMPVACPEWQLLPAYRPADHSERVARFTRSASR